MTKKPSARSKPGSGAPFAASDLLAQLPESVGAWARAAAYPRMRSAHDVTDTPSAASHYRQGDHVIVVKIADGSALGSADPNELAQLAGTHVVDAGTMTVEQLRGRWVREMAYRSPYTGKVVGGFSYNFRIDPKAMPRSDGLAFWLQVSLANGVSVSVNGPEDVDMAMVKEVFAGIDLARIEAMERGAK